MTMKLYKLTLILLILFKFSFSYAQEAKEEEPFTMTFPFPTGKWTSEYTWRIIDSSTVSNADLGSCDIIDYETNSISTAIFFTFEEEYIIIQRCGVDTKLPYKRNEDNHSFEFDWNNEHYSFTTFYNRKQMILVDQDQMVLVFTKSE